MMPQVLCDACLKPFAYPDPLGKAQQINALAGRFPVYLCATCALAPYMPGEPADPALLRFLMKRIEKLQDAVWALERAAAGQVHVGAELEELIDARIAYQKHEDYLLKADYD